ncbi:MAG: tetratricopeptide repeat protein, partial [Xenococcaceae cyanobacterium]
MLNQFKNILSSSLSNQEEMNNQEQDIDTSKDSVPTKTVESQLQLGDKLYHQGELEQALSYYRRAIEIDDKSTQAHQKLAMALQKSGNLPEAMIHYRKAIVLNNSRENIKEEKKSLSPDFPGKIFEQDLDRYTQINKSSFLSISSPSIDKKFPQNDLESTTKSTLVPTEKVNANLKREAAEVYLQQALAYGDEQRWQEVISACQQAVQIIPDLAEAYKLWGNALQKIGKTSEAMGFYAKALEIQPDLAEVYANLGTLYAQQKKWQKAQEYYQKAVVIKPDFAGAYRNLAKVWKQLGEPEKAAECQHKSLSLGSQIVNPEAYLQLGDRSIADNKPQQAIALYLQAIKLAPDLRIGYQKIAETWEKLGKWQEAATYYRQMLKLEPPSSHQQPQLPGKSTNQALPSSKQLIIPKLPEIRKSQQLLQASSPLSSPQNTVLQHSSNPTNKLDLAIAKYEEKVQQLTDSAPLQANLGSLYAQKQDWHKAVKSYQRAIQLDPTIAGVYRNLAKVLEKLGQEAKAAKCWYQALSLEPKSANAEQHFELGDTLSKQNLLEEAISCYRRAIELKPDYAQAYFRIGEILQSCGHNGEAIACCQKAIQLNNSQPSYYCRLGQILVQEKNLAQAIICYQQAIKLQPNHWETYHQLGKILSKLERWQEAVVVYNQALAINKKNPELYLGLGNALAKTAEIDKAIVAYQIALQIQPTNNEASVQLATILVKKDSNPNVDINQLEHIKSSQGGKLTEEEIIFEQHSITDNPIAIDSQNLFLGEVLCISGNQVIGWIDRRNIQSEEVIVRLRIDGCDVSNSKANLSKKDFRDKKLKNSKINKHCFFALQIPDNFLDGKSHCLEVVCPRETIIAKEENYRLGLKGNIDVLTNSRIAGWVIALNQNHSLDLDLYVDGIKIKSLVANIKRNDVKPGLPCGFDTYFAENLYAGQNISLTLKNSGIPILGTPKQVITPVGTISILYKISQAVKNNLVDLNEHEQEWVNSQLIPNLISKFRSTVKTNNQGSINYTKNQIVSSHLNRIKLSPVVDVVIPVYKNYQITKLCIESVLKFKNQNQTPLNIVVINDLTPEPQIAIYLENLAAQKSIQLLVNVDNQGFVRSVNQGMRLHPDRDVVLLNSDAIVHGDWLDRLRSVAYSQENIASVTPISNHASVFSYPFFAEEVEELPKDISLEALDKICQSVNQHVSVDAPSVHGFCCFLRRVVLDKIGLFDEQKWEKGYGEEVDWSQKALLLGWKHVAAPSIFVQHLGSQSFTESKHQAIQKAQQKISLDYPEYHAIVQDFIKSDPLAPFRRRIDVERLKLISAQYFLFISHNFGGGTHKYITDLSNRLAKEGYQVICLMPAQHNWIELCSLTEIQLNSKYKLSATSEFNALIEDLKSINVVHIHINSTLGFDDDNILWTIPDKLGVNFDVTIHDYQFICPRVNLTTPKKEYCGEPSVTACDKCIIKHGTYNDIGNNIALSNHYEKLGSVARWRSYYEERLKKARKVFAPTYDVKERMLNYFPELAIDTKYHPEPEHEFRLQSSNSRNINLPYYSVALIGAISDIKGFELLQKCAAYANNFNLSLKFIVFGFTKEDSLLEEYANISLMGSFQNIEHLKQKLTKHPCDIAAFLSIWPETYSYTLSEALSLGLIPLGLNIGAIGERISQIPGGVVLEPHATPKKIVSEMIRLAEF